MRSKILKNAKWVSENLNKNHVKILDATWYFPKPDTTPYHDFLKERISKSRFFDIDQCCDTNSPLPHMLPGEKFFQTYARNLGISNNSHVVIYDTNGVSAPRVYWMFKIYGHDPELVSIIDGGLPNFKEEYPKLKYPEFYETGSEETPVDLDATSYVSTFQKELVKDLFFIKENIETKKSQVVDARSAGRFKGLELEPRKGVKSGHIPNSYNVPYVLLYNKNNTFKTNEEIRNIFEEAGVDLNKNITLTCGSGVTACVLMFALEILGKSKGLHLYDGAWSEFATGISN